MDDKKDLTAVGEDILFTARNELYMHLPYMDVALCSLPFQPGTGITASLATDGEKLYYTGAWLADRYLRNRQLVNRAYLHVLLHCILRHIWKAKGRNPLVWDLACDTAVESILDSLNLPCIAVPVSPARQKFYGECRAEMPVLTAEGIYRMLLRRQLSEYELASLQRIFLVDDHGLWDMEQKDNRQNADRQEEQWQNMSERIETSLETVLAGEASGGEAVLEQVKVANRNDVDYRAFLRRFAVPREVMAIDGDAFDYTYYSYGLQLYGNMPLIEPPETKEEKRIEDFVIAVDTSMSTSGELVRQFLACTYSILRSTETFTRKVNIRILQCDDQIRSDIAIHDLEELKSYMEDFTLQGGSATDFRPVFEHVAKLQKQGVFTSLRGLIYFTDGMGIYPQKRPPYDAAFVLMEEPPISFKMPPWAIRLVLGESGLEKTIADLDENNEAYLEELPQL